VKLAVAALLAFAAGCTSPGTIKAYPGPGRSADELGAVETVMRSDTFRITDNEITSVDGVRFEKRGYIAQMLPGARSIGLQGTLRFGRQPRVQHCVFELNVDPGCIYRPAVPAYPRDALDLPADAEWRLTRSMTVQAECTEKMSYAVQVPIDCSSRPLCPTASGFGACP
jgi:hypothetical protein